MLLWGAGLCSVAIALGIGLLSDKREQQLGAAIVVDIEGQPPSAIAAEVDENPSSLQTAAAQIAEADATQSVADEQHSEEDLATEQEPAEKLFIRDAVRLKLTDPGLRKSVHPDDLAAIESFHAGQDVPALWIDSAGISPAGKAVLAELGKAEDWALEPSEFLVPPSDYQPISAEDQAAAEVAIGLAVLRYARYAQGGRLSPSNLSELIDQHPPIRDPKTVLTEIRTAKEPGL
ncbi:MAG: hypothetical protein PVJ31_06900, partial [Methyloceanibacter sp.]